MIKEAFGKEDPTTAQFDMPVEEFVRIFAPLKPAFIHHPESKRLIQAMLEDFGCDMETTYLDVPRLRAVTSDAYLTSGVGYAHHPHRDTWYSAPMCQLNWWLPIFEMSSESSMAFHPKYWSEPVKNGSSKFNYYAWNSTGRADAAKHIKSDTREQPKPEQPMELDPQVRVISEPGGALVFSAANMHSTVPNTSGKNPLQHRFPHRQPDRCEDQERRSQPRFASDRDLAARLHEGQGSEPDAGRCCRGL